MPAQSTWAIGRIQKWHGQAKLHLLKWVCQLIRRQIHIQNWAKLDLKTSGPWCTKWEFRNIMQNCFQMQENTLLACKVSFSHCYMQWLQSSIANTILSLCENTLSGLSSKHMQMMRVSHKGSRLVKRKQKQNTEFIHCMQLAWVKCTVTGYFAGLWLRKNHA